MSFLKVGERIFESPIKLALNVFKLSQAQGQLLKSHWPEDMLTASIQSECNEWLKHPRNFKYIAFLKRKFKSLAMRYSESMLGPQLLYICPLTHQSMVWFRPNQALAMFGIAVL